MKILLITGGDSSEREISLRSAQNVEQALKENSHSVTVYDLLEGYEPLKKLSQRFDVLFPVLHGEEGEGGKLHEFLSKLNKLVVGTKNYKGLHDAWFKIPFKDYCDIENVPTAAWKVVSNKQDILKFGFPSVLKASNGGSSREVAILKSKEDLEKDEYNKIMNLNTPLLVEKYLPGVEITTAVLNGKFLPIVEIVPTKHTWFSYEAKYDDTTKEIPFAPSVPKNEQKEAERITLKFAKDFNLGSYFRADFIINDGVPYALDINTIPAVTGASLLPKAAKAAGLSFNEFIEELVKSAK